MRIIRLLWPVTDPKVHFRVAMGLSILITLIHAAAFPLIASYDGMEYVRLARVLTSGAFPVDWNFFRTPLFPATLSVAFRLVGTQPNAALIVTTLLGWGGAVLMGSVTAKIAGRTAGAVALVLLVCYPVLTGYQHMLLTETGTFFCLALLQWSIVAFGRSATRESLIFPVVVVSVIGIGYYWRPTILYLSPVAAFVCLLVAWLPRQSSNPYAELLRLFRQHPMRFLPGALVLVVAPWLIAYPWMKLTARYTPQLGPEQIFKLGAFKQVLIPVDDPRLGALREPYRQAVESESVGGRLPINGLSVAHNMDLMVRVGDVVARIGAVRLVREHPYAYVSAVSKSMLFYLGVPGSEGDDENGNFSRFVFTLWQPSTNLDAVLGWSRELKRLAPPVHDGNGLIGRFYSLLSPFYTGLVLLASVVSLGWLGISAIRANPFGLAVTALPIAFLFIHAITLFDADRYGFPVYPILLANLVAAISLTCGSTARVLGRLMWADSGRADRSTLSQGKCRNLEKQEVE